MDPDPEGDPMKQRLTFTVTLTVDVEGWADEYGEAVEDVVEDVRNYLDSTVQCVTGADFWSEIDVVLAPDAEVMTR